MLQQQSFNYTNQNHLAEEDRPETLEFGLNQTAIPEDYEVYEEGESGVAYVPRPPQKSRS